MNRQINRQTFGARAGAGAAREWEKDLVRMTGSAAANDVDAWMELDPGHINMRS